MGATLYTNLTEKKKPLRSLPPPCESDSLQIIDGVPREIALLHL